jgi:hypothetical protein
MISNAMIPVGREIVSTAWVEWAKDRIAELEKKIAEQKRKVEQLPILQIGGGFGFGSWDVTEPQEWIRKKDVLLSLETNP